MVKRLSIPYYRQHTEYWCGPASLQMLVHAVHGKRIPQRKLARMCGTTKKNATRVSGLRRAARWAGFWIQTKTNAAYVDMQRILRRRLPVLVLYREPDDNEWHYAIVIHLTRKHIVLNDPWHGRGFTLSRKEFLHRWKIWSCWKWMMWSAKKKKYKRTKP